MQNIKCRVLQKAHCHCLKWNNLGYAHAVTLGVVAIASVVQVVISAPTSIHGWFKHNSSYQSRFMLID